VLLILLWMASVLQEQLRVVQSRLESLEREQSTIDDQLSFLAQISQRREGSSLPPPDAASLPLSSDSSRESIL